MGQWIEPTFRPLVSTGNMVWQSSPHFWLAKFLSAHLGTLFGIEGGEENIISLAEHIQNSGLPVGAGFALSSVFLYCPAMCIHSAVLRKETGSWRLPTQLFVSYSILAYAAAWLDLCYSAGCIAASHQISSSLALCRVLTFKKSPTSLTVKICLSGP